MTAYHAAWAVALAALAMLVGPPTYRLGRRLWRWIATFTSLAFLVASGCSTAPCPGYCGSVAGLCVSSTCSDGGKAAP